MGFKWFTDLDLIFLLSTPEQWEAYLLKCEEISSSLIGGEA